MIPHLNEGLKSYKGRLNGDIVKGKEMHGSYIDLGLYTLFSNVLVVIIDAERITPSSLATEDAKACTELWFDRIAEEDFPKTRVVCVILHREHFQLGVVRSPQVRGIFQLGHAWDQARRLILTFLKGHTPGQPLGPNWKSPFERDP